MPARDAPAIPSCFDPVPGNRSAILNASSAPCAVALSTLAIMKTAKSPARNKVDFMVSSRSKFEHQQLSAGLLYSYRLDRLLLPLEEREPLLDEREPLERALLRLELREPDERTPLLRPLDDERLTERPLLLLEERLGARCTERLELRETEPREDELLEPELYDLDEPLLVELDVP
jgi:hypothetical protein